MFRQCQHCLKVLLLPLSRYKSAIGGLLSPQVCIGKSIHSSMGVHVASIFCTMGPTSIENVTFEQFMCEGGGHVPLLGTPIRCGPKERA